MIKVLLATLIVAMCCTGALASVGLEPASGYVHLPDAQVVQAGNIEGFAGYVSTRGTNELGRAIIPPICDGNGYTLGAVGGLGRKLELGVGFTSIDKDAGNADAFGVAAKWRFFDRPESGWALALGASYRNWNTDMQVSQFGDVISLDLPAVTSIYLAADKTFRPCTGSVQRVIGTIGVVYDDYSSSHLSSEGDFPFSAYDVPISESGCVAGDSFVSPFIGARVEAAKWSLLGEFRPKLETDGFSYQSILWSLAVNARIGDSTSATAGVSTFNLPYTRSDPAFFFEITHRFGK